MRVVVINHVSLDGVLQGPGGPDEDPRDGFLHGGWAALHQDPAVGEAMGTRMGPDFTWLFGRRTYEQVLGHWNAVGGPFKDGLNGPVKYVASSHPDLELPWPSSVLLSGDVPARVAELRGRPGGNLVVMGSGALVRSLLPHGLVDELVLLVHPVVLGSGHRLFGPDPLPRRFSLVSADPTPSGILVSVYAVESSDEAGRVRPACPTGAAHRLGTHPAAARGGPARAARPGPTQAR